MELTFIFFGLSMTLIEERGNVSMTVIESLLLDGPDPIIQADLRPTPSQTFCLNLYSWFRLPRPRLEEDPDLPPRRTERGGGVTGTLR